VLPRIVYQQYFLAKLHRWSRFDNQAFLMAYRVGTVGMVTIGVVVAVVVAAGGWFAIPAVFGAAYEQSASVMVLLAVAIPLRFGAASVESLLTTGGLLRRKVIYQGIGAAAYILALAVAIPLLGLVGAALAPVVAEAIFLALFWIAVKRHVVAGAELPSWAEIRRRLTA
jgi:O-antigen/teichoic acid export membrane protein